MSFIKKYYFRFLVWLGAVPPPGYEYLLQPKQKQEGNLHAGKSTTSSTTAETNITNSRRHNIGNLLYEGFYQLIEDVIRPIRVLLATFIVFLTFLGTDQLLFWIFNLITQEIQARQPFLSLFLEGVEILTAFSIAIYFVISGIANLRFQWQFSQEMEKISALERNHNGERRRMEDEELLGQQLDKS